MSAIKALVAILVSSSLTHASPARTPNTTSPPECDFWTEPKLGIAEVMKNWGIVWRGERDAAVINHTITPDVVLYTDRLPTGPDPLHLPTAVVDVHTAEELLEYVGSSRAGFSSYGFVSNFFYVDTNGTRLTSRWTLNATVGEDTTSPIRKAGDIVTMNGTDIIGFDHCSGRIAEIYTAQDTLSYAYQMGLNIFAEGPAA